MCIFIIRGGAISVSTEAFDAFLRSLSFTFRVLRSQFPPGGPCPLAPGGPFEASKRVSRVKNGSHFLQQSPLYSLQYHTPLILLRFLCRSLKSISSSLYWSANCPSFRSHARSIGIFSPSNPSLAFAAQALSSSRSQFLVSTPTISLKLSLSFIRACHSLPLSRMLSGNSRLLPQDSDVRSLPRLPSSASRQPG